MPEGALGGGEGAGTDWLPPFTEWDFRTIRERESRLACCWEYARSTPAICHGLTAWIDGPGGATVLGNFICNDGARFPEPWVLCGDELRDASELVEPDESPITVYSLAARKAFVLREVAAVQAAGLDVLPVLEKLLLAEGYVMTLEFESWGSDAVGRALTQLARQEAKKFPRVRRGKGAVPPFEWLKWLAALRLEAARLEAGLSFAEVQTALVEHQRQYPIAEASPTLPLYASHGAWSKATGGARRGGGWRPRRLAGRRAVLSERRERWRRRRPGWWRKTPAATRRGGFYNLCRAWMTG